MKTMIIYASKTGHTKKIALAMGEQLGVAPKEINENPAIENVDVLFMGGGVYAGKSAPELLKFADTLSKENIRKVVLFSTCTSGENNMQDLRDLLTSKDINIHEKSFVCKGQFLLFSRKHPNDEDVKKAKSFAADMASVLKVNQ